MDPNLLYARLPRFYQGLVLSFDVTAASAYLEATTVNLAEYAGMNNGVQAVLKHTTEDLVIVGDSQSSSATQLNRHRELTAKFQSAKYLHVVREFNAAADSLASQTLVSKAELTTLNRFQDAIYEPTAKAETEDKPSVNMFRTHTGRLTVTTRQQAKVNEKRVRFANEASVVDRRDVDSEDKANDVAIKVQNHVREEQLITEDSTLTVPSANDIDPLTVQQERRRRIAVAQGEVLRWSHLKTVLRGEDSKLGYRTARNS
ncbi:Hypothetical protein PHPALM_16487 [Phytophthora palmivora]|uniref:RNase H type-1 domain-containing protein n=1 Tax=Phytophthora palmivora TaxID=4796 RepID=A0A2P4XPM5_9STRA|nr:Hypothetical protein PHPALM_16487 [Phytophthora palmivora]